MISDYWILIYFGIGILIVIVGLITTGLNGGFKISNPEQVVIGCILIVPLWGIVLPILTVEELLKKKKNVY